MESWQAVVYVTAYLTTIGTHVHCLIDNLKLEVFLWFKQHELVRTHQAESTILPVKLKLSGLTVLTNPRVDYASLVYQATRQQTALMKK